jgi:hypothetical protein
MAVENPMSRRFLGLLLAGLVVLPGCAALSNLNLGALGKTLAPLAPTIDAGTPRLVQAPSNRALGVWLCGQVASPVICQLIGGPVSQSQLQFAFELPLKVHNPNTFAVPVVEMLAAFTAYPGQGGQSLGAACLTFCPDGQACPQNQPGACRQRTGSDIQTMDDFAGATAGFLVGTLLGTNGVNQLGIKTVPANGALQTAVRLELGMTPMLQLIQKMSGSAVAQVKQGKQPSFAIPWQVKGSAWIDVTNFGRLAAPYGPIAGQWQLQ